MAKARAVVVFPTPGIPVNRYAWGTLSQAITCFKNRFGLSWPMTWENMVKLENYPR
jgi:hypothetical protein